MGIVCFRDQRQLLDSEKFHLKGLGTSLDINHHILSINC